MQVKRMCIFSIFYKQFEFIQLHCYWGHIAYMSNNDRKKNIPEIKRTKIDFCILDLNTVTYLVVYRVKIQVSVSGIFY